MNFNKILIFGLGALGTVFAVSLKFSGNRVYGFIKDEYLPLLRSKPLKIKGLLGEKEAFLDDLFTKPEELKNVELDLIILTVKAFDTEKAILQIKDFIKPNTFLLLAQNGYGNYEIATQILKRDRIILSRIIFGARLIEPGFSEVTVFGDDVVIGQPENTIPESILNEIANTFNRAGIPTRVSNKVYSILWDKIIYNCALNPLGAILECSYGDLASQEETKSLMDKIIEEIFLVAEHHKIKLNWKDAEEYKNYFYKNLIPPTAKHYPSMYYDIKANKKTEIDALNGAIVKLAKEKNLNVPVNEFITLLIKAKENIHSK
ncbi:MAG: 2-dehydropantoate 2-reductase [Thermodesulfobacterium geofontis]|uniref:2-dehydropantoate 2-reductase n=1 Tax=Thermodesulfobacterium geofontis TaxID=1295609 RepID=A0A2N7QF16_9BACT|nr:MAG: 2-dehydropantoate 2-reductase [Thermodesulfobacterium geofontis]